MSGGGELHGREIAVVGMAGRFPGAADLEQFWRNLEAGVEAVRPVSDEELLAAGVDRQTLADPRYVKAASPLAGVELFDADFFDFSPREAEILDPQQRLFLESAWAALESAGWVPGKSEGAVGVYAGVAWNTYLLSNLTSHRELFEGAGAFQVFITSDKDFMPTRVSYKLDLKGPSVVVQTSCSTSLVAVHLACLSLLSYECDLALAGGVTVKVPQLAGHFHQPGGLASPDGHCRAFDARGAGTIFGSGVGVVVLKRLEEAVADGDPIRAVIKGSAINNDGSLKVSYTAPSVEGQAEVIAAALEIAEVDPETLRYIEAHGTGTALGDPIEVAALTKVFRQHTAKRGFCSLGSLKTNVGHLDAAAGVGGLIKTVLALENRRLPPSLHFERPNPEIDFAASPFTVQAALAEWPREGFPRRAAVSSFGVGGTNAHAIVEEAPEPPPSGPSRPAQLFLLSAKSSAALAAAEQNLAAFLRRSDAALADVAYTLEVGRAHFRHRSAVPAFDREAAAAALEGGGGLLRAVLGEDAAAPRLAFLFPGQGTQTVGMGRGLYEREEVFRGTVERCAEALAEPLGLDLRRLLYPPPEAEDEARRRLVDTRFAQPALFAVELALARLWMAWGFSPAAMLGHSIGEWVAACLAGVVSTGDALALVAERGRLMAEQPPGAMLAVPLGEAEVAALVADRDLELAAFNEPSRVVVAGPEAAVEELAAELASRRVGARRLHTSHAFHSPMMEPAVAPFVAAVRRVTLKAPEIPFLSNLTGTWITAEEATDPDYWGRQLRRPVRFAAGVGELLAEPRCLLLEVGPGRTLTTLAGRHPARGGQPLVASLAVPRQQADDLATVLAARGRLWLAGAELDAAAFWAGEERRRLPLPTYPFVGRRYWIEPGAAAARSSASSEAAAPEKRDDVGCWFYLPAFKPSLPPRGGGEAPPEPWLIFLDPCDVGAALAARVRAAGRRAITVKADLEWGRLGDDAYGLRPGRGEDYDRLFAELGERSAFPGAVVHLWSLTHVIGRRVSDAETFELSQETGFYSLLHLARALGRIGAKPAVDLTVVADRLLAVTGAETPQPAKATLLGLLRVLPQELPHLTCRAIDVEPEGAFGGEPAARLAARLEAEVAAKSPEAAIAWRGGGRFVESLEPVRLERRADDLRPFRRRGVYLLTGSLDGDTLALARLLARVAGARLAVVEPAAVVDPATADRAPADRETADPAPADRRRQLEELGAEVLLLAADLGDPAAVAAAVAAAEDRFGALDGVIHTAGAAGEQNFRALGETGSAECAWHFVPKIHGLYALDQALAGRRLEVRLLLSSLASLLGGLAYGAYAAANAFLDARAAAGAGGDGGWQSIGWEVWQSGAEGDGITIVRRDLAALAMTRDEGEEAFLRAAAAGTPRILVSTADLAARAAHARARLETLRDRRPPGAAREAHPRPELDTPYAPPESDLERRLVELWGGVLGFAGIGVDDNFFELGGDSLLAIEVVERLRQGEGVDLPVARLYQGLTVRALVRVLARAGEAGDDERRSELAERRQAMDRRRQFQRSRRTRGES